MTPNDYQRLALRTENTPKLVFDGQMAGNFTGMMRAAVKVGDMQDLIKKHIIYGKEFDCEGFGYAAMALDETSEFIGGDGLITLDAQMSRVVHGAVGVVTEAGELQQMVSRCISANQPVDRLNLKEELGDILWYVALAADAGGLTLEEVMERNIEKLRARYGDKFTEEAALVRDLEREKAALEGPQTIYIDVGNVTKDQIEELLKAMRKTSAGANAKGYIGPDHIGPDPVDVARTISERIVSVEA